MKLDDLAYNIFIDEFGFISIHYFIKNKKKYQSYYNKANSILRKEKLKALNEI